MRTVRSVGFALFCIIVVAAIVVPAARAQRRTAPDGRPRDARTVTQEKISVGVMTAIRHRRGDARGKTVSSSGNGVRIDRHGRALVDVRAQVRPELERKMKALGGLVVSRSEAYDSIVGWMPLLTIERLAADPSVRSIQPAQ